MLPPTPVLSGPIAAKPLRPGRAGAQPPTRTSLGLGSRSRDWVYWPDPWDNRSNSACWSLESVPPLRATPERVSSSPLTCRSPSSSLSPCMPPPNERSLKRREHYHTTTIRRPCRRYAPFTYWTPDIQAQGSRRGKSTNPGREEGEERGAIRFLCAVNEIKNTIICGSVFKVFHGC